MTELHEAYNEKKKDTFFGVSLFISVSKLFEAKTAACMHTSWIAHESRDSDTAPPNVQT